MSVLKRVLAHRLPPLLENRDVAPHWQYSAPRGMHPHCRHWPDAAIPAVCSSAGTLNISATPVMNDPFIAKAAAKAASFAEISGFTIVSGQSNVIIAADDSVDLASNSLTGAKD
jgi:hypothetical protein